MTHDNDLQSLEDLINSVPNLADYFYNDTIAPTARVTPGATPVPLLQGDWEAQPNSVWKFRCKDKSGLLWSETKGTIWFDGQPAVKAALSSNVETLLADGVVKATIEGDSTIFVVHGRDHEARDQLELILRRLGLEPYVLQVTGGGGDTLIEALERQIGKSAHSSFGIVLATPDDMGYLRSEKPEEAKARARQNVIMCPPSGLLGQNGWIEEGRVSGSS